ncbi:MAG: tetratricopeptide repeat protein [Candidatus Hydrogenedentota bacterium]
MAPDRPQNNPDDAHEPDAEAGEGQRGASMSEDEFLSSSEMEELLAGGDVDTPIGPSGGSGESPGQEAVPGSSASGAIPGDSASSSGVPLESEDSGGTLGNDLLSQDDLDNLLNEVRGGSSKARQTASAREPSAGPAPPEHAAEEASSEKASEPQPANPTPEPESAVAGGSAPQEEATAYEERRPRRDWLGELGRILPEISLTRALKISVVGSAALAAGLSLYAALAAYPVREPGPGFVTDEAPVDIAHATQHARNLIDLGRHGEAARVLSSAIARTPESPMRADARFMWAEAAYEALPDEPEEAEITTLLNELDQITADHADHPRLPEARFWQARLNEELGMEYAARNLYADIVTHPEPPGNMDEVLFAAGRLALALDEPAEAADLLRRLVEQHPDSSLLPRAQLLLGDAYAAAGQRDQAERRYEETVALGGAQRAQAIERLARLAHEEGDHERAVELLDDYLAGATSIEGNDPLYLLLAQAYRALGQTEEAERALRELLNFFPETEVTPLALVELAQILEDMGRRGEALRLARQVTAQYPEAGEAVYEAGQLMRDAGELEEAAGAFALAAEEQVDDPEAHLAAGKAYRSLDRNREAFDVFERIGERFPGTEAAREASIEAAEVLYEMGRAREAVARLEELEMTAEAGSHYRDAVASLAAIYADIGLRQESNPRYQQVAARTEDPELLAEAAIALLEGQAWDQGLAVAERAPVDELPEEQAYRLLTRQGEALLRADAERGLALLEEAQASYPDHVDAEDTLLLLDAYLATDQTAQARSLVRELEIRAQEEPRMREHVLKAAVRWADHLYDRGDYRAAAEAYAVAVEASDNDGDNGYWAEFQRANALMRFGEYERSAEQYGAIAQSDSPWAEAAETKARYARQEHVLRGGEPLAAGPDEL